MSELRTVILQKAMTQIQRSSQHSYLVFDTLKLPWPACVIEERSVVKALVGGTVALRVVGWCHGGHLVAVY